jgi:molybdopterin biosynthesis enzyme MoaB
LTEIGPKTSHTKDVILSDPNRTFSLLMMRLFRSEMNSKSARLRPAILIISETAFKEPSTDEAGDILRETLNSEGGDKWTEPLVEIVPDDATRIEVAIRRWTDDDENYVNLVVTTGGTGFAVKDITPEVGYRS